MRKPGCLKLAGKKWEELTFDTTGMKELISSWPFLAMDIETYGFGKKPGCVSGSLAHGIFGISMANPIGQAGWVTVKPIKYRGAFDEFINHLNSLIRGKTLIFHNGKFDLGFLTASGLDISDCRVVDTWILHSILSRNQFHSGKLKDLARTVFGIKTESEEAIKKSLADLGTEDYGELPVTLLAPYACDDVRYAMALFFAMLPRTNEKIWKFHDLYLEVSLLANQAENRGLRTADNFARIAAFAKKGLEKAEKELNSCFDRMNFDFRDDQALLRLLHQTYSGDPPFEMFGEVKYRPRWETLAGLEEHSVVKSVFPYFVFRNFLNVFSVEAAPERFVDNGKVFCPSFLLRIFGRGGEIRFSKPDFRDEVPPAAFLKGIFRPREKFRFLACEVRNLKLAILAEMLESEQAVKLARSEDVLGDIAAGANLGGHSGRLVASCLLRQIFDGFGMAALRKYLFPLSQAGIPKNIDPFEVKGKFERFLGISELRSKLRLEIKKKAPLRDLAGREIRIPEEKEYRSISVLLNSSYGNLTCLLWRDLARAGRKFSALPACFEGATIVFEAPEEKISGLASEIRATFFGGTLSKIFRTLPSFFCNPSDAWPVSFSGGGEDECFLALFKGKEAFGEDDSGVQEVLFR